MRNTITFLFTFIVSAVWICSCGEGTVEIGENTYTPKIVVEGYLCPGQKVRNIRVTRNIPLNTSPNPLSVILSGADVRIVDLQTNKEFNLTYNRTDYAFEYNGSDLSINYDDSYLINVNADIDGRNLQTSATTRVPRAGFKINLENSNILPMYYRERDENNNVKNFSIAFSPSPATEFYVFSIVPLDASDSTFNYDNAYVAVDKEDVAKELDRFKYQLRWLQNVNSYGEEIIFNVDWINLWFYGRYRIIAYAGDDNYKNYALTYKMVQEFDGNFHEPKMKLSGDGIGVFASVIPDTVYIEIKRR